MSSSTADQTPTEKIILTEKQRLAFYSPATEILFGGAAGPGKSLTLRCSGIRWCELIPGIQVYLFRRTFPDLRENHLRGNKNIFTLLARKLEYGSVKYNKQENEFVWQETGSRYSLHHCQHEDDVQNYQGAEIHVLQIDELTHFTEYQYRFLRGRVRCVGLEVPQEYKALIPRIETSSNPGSQGHKWVKKTFVTVPMEISQRPMDDGGMKRQFIPAKSKDNPHLTKDDPGYDARLRGLGSDALVRAMEEGDWDIFEGQFFDEWRKDVHVLPWNFKAADHWTWFFSYDYGYGHPAVFYACAVDEQGIVYVMHEIALVRTHVDVFAAAIKDQLGPELHSKIDIVHTGWDCFLPSKDGGPSIADKFSRLPAGLRLNLVKASQDRVNRAAQVRDYLKFHDVNGERLGPRVFVHPSCKRLIDCLPTLIHDPKNVEAPLKVDADELNPWIGDDPYEAFSYGLMSRPLASKKQDERLKKLDSTSRMFWRNHGEEMKEMLGEANKSLDFRKFYGL